MEATATELAEYIVDRLANTPTNRRLLIGISGVPASGKSTIAQLLVNLVNSFTRPAANPHEPSSQNSSDLAILVGLDGWHLTRAQLDAFPDPVLAHNRRGAHWTFDGEAYVNFVRELKKPIQTNAASLKPEEIQNTIIYAPSFSHETKDPIPNDIAVHPRHRVVIIEGLYTFLSIPPWVEAAKQLDERWWVEVDEEEAERRLIARHVKTGVAKDLQEAEWRSRENDRPNGRFVKENMLEPTRVIRSIDDPVL
ncbi:P-loop containing nucleoside triphosphate hydrolase protein, partial [Panus rudis PR-1116 ss-1]